MTLNDEKKPRPATGTVLRYLLDNLPVDTTKSEVAACVKDFYDRTATRIRCLDCRKHCGMFMLQPKMWQSITKPEERKAFLCVQCAEMRHGRAFKLADFEREALCNDVIFAAFHMGLAAAMREMRGLEDLTGEKTS